MSLYYEAAGLIENPDKKGGSLKSRVFGSKTLKSNKAAIFALVTESTKWSPVLKDVVEKSGILKLEKKLTPLLAILLTHDLLLSKRGVAAHADHALKLAITRHKARLKAEFTKIRVTRGFASVDAFRAYINEALEQNADGETREPEHPRWVRVNTVKTTLEEQLTSTFSSYEQKQSLRDVMSSPASAKVLHIDEHIPDLIALPPRADLTKNPAYQKGQLIIQDKASCFPAYLLDVQQEDGDIIDACAAPGNKTTHLAALVSKAAKAKSQKPKQHIFACERDKERSKILQRMIETAHATKLITVKSNQDFTRINPQKSDEVSNVGALLLDPSCSGSGIVGRDDTIKIVLPSAVSNTSKEQARGKKRKRKAANINDPESSTPAASATTAVSITEEEQDDPASSAADLQKRLASLAAFQLKIVTHAMAFPRARKITYSTCSIHAEENEHVTLRALASGIARRRGWRVLRRDEQVDGMKRWNVRGTKAACASLEGVGHDEDLDVVADACIRCEKGTEEGTMGFFVVGFIREGEDGEDDVDMDRIGDAEAGAPDVENGEDEWEGFSD
ncbi:S-adenosyl-L-methionine-dependent methyltransferase [Phyllosticta capitalensis]|uniref:S-adenosyl-L-methionine-dependent methyltransferase n=1 Tax=Phyllosticta capitalensis TaxID=121624 RepID=A0ABR1YLZ3_9PEZI